MITVKQVSYLEGYETVSQLTEDHWNEVPFGPFQLSLELDTATYVTAEDNGNYLLLLAYDGDTPVGYFSVLAATMLQHSSYMQMTTDAYYVAPTHRKRGVFQLMLQKLESLCDQHNIRFLSIGINPNTEDVEALRSFLSSQEYHTTEFVMTKEIS